MYNNDLKLIDVENGLATCIYKDHQKITLPYKDYLDLKEAIANPIYTKNCAFRIVCGRLGSIASMMALQSTLATTINGNIPGAGAISSNGSTTMVQHYFAQTSYLTDWYKRRGMNEFGYALDGSDNEDFYTSDDDEDVDLFADDEEEITIERTKTEIDFAGVHGEVDTTAKQTFEEV